MTSLYFTFGDCAKLRLYNILAQCLYGPQCPAGSDVIDSDAYKCLDSTTVTKVCSGKYRRIFFVSGKFRVVFY